MAKPDNKGIYTFQDWLTWEGAWELINGKAYGTSPAPTSLHSFIVGELHFSLRTFFQNRKCFVFVAPFDVYFSENEQYDVPDHVVQPDLSVVLYQKYGVNEYGIVDPGNQTVHVYTLEEGSYQNRHLYTEQETIQSELYPELEIPLRNLFKLN
ncbi:Uma2 family endonuclease [Paenibacillus sp. JNUCC31]|uniref:Uma2 family endonuclease n=1 Tax=Paenibacillus sp. JNUCC-31 TaxID=2777983 RepID=UPI0017848175|nr:Uma2 family endonuclease [Paenibacillus sp. JNUCC-31]QOS77033.1 Uma2 family endonuclease [Paenibacillus sp. JNUCC-31]